MLQSLENKIKRIAEAIREGQESRREVVKLIEQLGVKRDSTVMFSVDVKSMIPSLRKEEIFRIVNKVMRQKFIDEWDSDRM